MTFSIQKMILNEDFFDDVNSEDIINTETEETDKTFQHSVSITYAQEGSAFVDNLYSIDDYVPIFAIRLNKIYKRINILLNNAPFISDYKINICTHPIDKCNAVRKFGPYEIHYNDAKPDSKLNINIMFDCGYVNLSNIVNFFFQLFKTQIKDSDFVVDVITIENPKHFNYGDYSIKTYTFVTLIGDKIELGDWNSINHCVKFLSEEFCKPGAYSIYTNKRRINNGRYFIDKYFSKALGVKYVNFQDKNVYINNCLDEINVDNYIYGLYNPKDDGVSAELGNREGGYTNYDLKLVNPIKIEDKLKEYFKEPHSAYVYTFRNSSLKPYLLYCFDDTLIINDVEYVVFIYDACLKTADTYEKANFIKLMTPYKESDMEALNYYRDNFYVQMEREEYKEILSIFADKSYYETKS